MNASLNRRQDAVVGPSWLSSSRTGLALGLATVLSVVVSVVEGSFGAHGGGAFWVVMVPFTVVGALVARRQPGNPIGPILLLLTFAVVAAGDAGGYSALRYHVGDHGLPFGPVAVFLGTPGAWMWLVVLLPLPIALFPDGRLSPWWRHLLWGYLAVCAIFVATNAWQNIGGMLSQRIQVDSKGQLQSTSNTPGGNATVALFIAAYLGFCLAWVLRLILAYRRSTGAYRQQLKTLAIGGALCLSGLVLVTGLSNTGSSILRAIGGIGLGVGLVALPVSFGVGILRYRLYEIDRLISRTISYLLVTGLLVSVFLSLVLLTTRVLPFSSPVGVAASTLAAAGLFNPLRLRVQRLVDMRFDRARYDAPAIVAAFSHRLRDTADLDTVRGELLRVVDGAVAPAHTTLWIRPSESRSHG